MKKGFTLIELLIVVAIIAILAAIAVPNFLEAQTRAKVARVKNDQRSMATAIESYYIDNNTYPLSWRTGVAIGSDNFNAALAASFGITGPQITQLQAVRTFTQRGTGTTVQISLLTTPVSFITSYFPDPFLDFKSGTFGYYQDTAGWILWSPGPDADLSQTTDLGLNNSVETVYSSAVTQPSPTLTAWYNSSNNGYTYDSTNGTISQGDVWRVKQ